MKKIIFLIAMALVAIITIRCKEDAEIPALKFDIDVKTDATISERGINDESVIKFDLKTDYDYAAAPLSYKVSYENIGILKLNGEELNKDTTYKLNKPELTLSYFGKEAGKHTIKVHFFNDKGINVLKEIEIPYVKYNFTVSTVGDEAPYQGELKEYKLTITPENTTVKDSYKIKFISYDENDPSLQKSYVALNGTKIEFNKVYDIDVTKEQKITLKSFHSGAKNLIYTIINNSSEKQEKIGQNIKASEIEVKNLSFNKLTTNTLGDNLQLRGFINKTPSLSKGIQYRTWIVEVPNEQKDGIENTDNTYKDFTLPDNNEFVLNVKVKKYGTYKYMLQFKDEFGTESAPTSFDIKAIDKNFEVEQIVPNLENVIQGQDIDINFTVKEVSNNENETYQVQFLEFDRLDENLRKSKIYLNDTEVQLNKWYIIERKVANHIKLNVSTAGNKTLKYQIKNSIYDKTNTVTFNVKKTTISLKNLTIKATKIFINEPFKIEGIVEKTYSKNKNIEYKTWLTLGNAPHFNGLTNTYKPISLSSDNILSLSFYATDASNYKLHIQAKDEFGNESDIREFPITVNYKTFAIKQVNDVLTDKYQGQDISFVSSVEADNNQNGEYKVRFLSFDSQDINLQKSYINLNGNPVRFNVEYSFKEINNSIVVNSFHHGDVKLVYEVWRAEMPNYKVKKETDINIKKGSISANLNIDKTEILTNSPFVIQGKVSTLSRGGKIYYRTWAEKNVALFKGFGEQKWRSTDEVNSTKERWVEYVLNNNSFSVSNQTTDKNDNYRFFIQFKDEFGNESEVIRYDIKVIPPIIIDRMSIQLNSPLAFSARNRNMSMWWGLNFKVRSSNSNVGLRNIETKSYSKTYSIEKNGTFHKVTISVGDDTFNLNQKLDVESNRQTDSPINISWVINEDYRYKDKIRSIKSALLEKVREDFKIGTYTFNVNGQSVYKIIYVTNWDILLDPMYDFDSNNQ